MKNNKIKLSDIVLIICTLASVCATFYDYYTDPHGCSEADKHLRNTIYFVQDFSAIIAAGIILYKGYKFLTTKE